MHSCRRRYAGSSRALDLSKTHVANSLNQAAYMSETRLRALERFRTDQSKAKLAHKDEWLWC
jgi:hypothetical protein